jgi:hypothetical protein
LLVAAHFGLSSNAVADTYRINVKADPEKSRADGTMTLRYQNLEKQTLPKLRLRLDPNLSPRGRMTIASVRAKNGTELPWRYLPFKFGKTSSERGQVEIDLPEPLGAKGELELTVSYSLEGTGFLNKEMIILQDDPYHSFDAWYPKAMTHTGHDWSTNDDRLSQYDVTIELPAALKSLASTGKLVGKRREEAGNAVFQLRAEGVRGFTIYESPSWEEHRQTAEGVDIGVHLPANNREWAKRMLDAAADVIAFYRSEYGKYPGDHLEIICPGSLTDRAHGSSATCHGITVWLHSHLEDQYRWLIAHEVAHQYFGTSIGIARDEIAWASIGIGMTMDHDYMVQRGLDVAATRKTMRWFYLEAVRRGYDTKLSQPVEGPMMAAAPWSSGWNMSLMHGKAYEVCTMLRDLLGKDKYRAIIRKILDEKKGGLLRNRDFVKYCKEASAEPLDWFFADWVDGNCALDYAVTSVDPANGRVEVSKIGGAAFPVTVEVETVLGKRLRQRVDRSKAVNRLTFAGGDALKSVVIDPEGTYPDVDISNNRWPKPAAGREAK